MAVTLALSLLVIAGWIWRIDFLLRIYPGQVSMKFNSALGLLFAAAATWLLATGAHNGRRRLIAYWLVLFMCLIGAVTLWEYISGSDVGIDELVVTDTSFERLIHPGGRMSLLAAVQFVVLGTCLFCWNRCATAIYQFTCLSLIGFISSLMLVGVNFINDAPHMLKMALHLSLGFILLSMATWYLQPALHDRVRFERRLYTGFGSVLLLVIVIAVYTSFNNRERIKQSFWIKHTSEVILALSEFIGSATDLKDSAHFFSGNDHGQLASPAAGTALSQLQKIKTLTIDNVLQQKRVDSLLNLLHPQKGIPFGRERAKQVLDISERMAAVENNLLLKRQEDNEKSIVSSNRIFFVFIVFACVLLTGLFVAVRYNYLAREKSEEKFKALLESAPDAKVITDERGIIQLVNLQTEQMFGYKREELVGKPVETLMPEGIGVRDADHRLDFIHESPMREMGSGLELNARRKNNSMFPVEISLAPIRTEEGLWVSASIRDIEERKKAQTRIASLAKIIDNTSEAVFSSNEFFKIMSWNKAAEDLFGFTEKEAMGKPVVNLIRPQVGENERKHIRTELHKAGFWKGEITYLRKDGAPLYLSVSNTVTRDPQGRVDGYISVCMDYSHRKKLEEQLRAANTELEAFTYSVSHDLRAPIRAIIGFTNILETEYTGQLDGEARRLTGIIKTNTERMGNLIDDLLGFTRTSRQNIIRSNISMTAMVNELATAFHQGYPKVAWEIHDMPETKADLTMIRQVWMNLIGNAVKYSSRRPDAKIEIGGATTGFEHVYYIRDNGVGFNPAYQSKLFQVFQRLHSQEEFEGTGVGLAIVEKIVSKHGGRVWAESDGHTGAIFYFSLPINEEKTNI
ncbi:PAS domain S-box protein [Sediminibacterium soli]|uniref:PAS domain S-box protein n=1 Tax=Sediminibacterium soli TaxID=2698829 RepID=UPI001379D3E2|nr:PAS domain S-box protein [Sediminibacterium soli]NCI47980.1 PAS domain S-box protein [Sediminibacterium soli]